MPTQFQSTGIDNRPEWAKPRVKEPAADVSPDGEGVTVAGQYEPFITASDQADLNNAVAGAVVPLVVDYINRSMPSDAYQLGRRIGESIVKRRGGR